MFMNGATLIYRIQDNTTQFVFELLSTTRILSVLPDLRSRNDSTVPFDRPEMLWNNLIPVFDLGDTEFLFCEAARQTSGEYEVFYGYLECGPDEWRNFPSFAPSVSAALRKILEDYTNTGEVLDFH
jgi:hypothetical protein